MNKRNELIIKLGAIVLIVLIFVGINALITSKHKKNLGDYNGSTEYIETVNLNDYVEKKDEQNIKIEFDMRVDIPGEVRVMSYKEGGEIDFWFEEERVFATSEFEHYCISTTLYLFEKEEEMSPLCFFGGYGSGVIPHVKNISIVESKD